MQSPNMSDFGLCSLQNRSVLVPVLFQQDRTKHQCVQIPLASWGASINLLEVELIELKNAASVSVSVSSCSN